MRIKEKVFEEMEKNFKITDNNRHLIEIAIGFTKTFKEIELVTKLEEFENQDMILQPALNFIGIDSLICTKHHWKKLKSEIGGVE